MENNIEQRLRTLLEIVARTGHKWKEIESMTGIAAASWVDFNRGKKRATAEMIGAVCCARPEYSLWLTTGLTDPDCGYSAPQSGEAMDSKSAYLKAALHERILKGTIEDGSLVFAGRTPK